MKKTITLPFVTLLMLTVFLGSGGVQAANDYQGLLFGVSTTTYWEDGAKKTALTEPSASDGVTYLPLRIISTYIGKDVAYNKDDGSATITDKDTGDWISFNQNAINAKTSKGDIPLQRKPFAKNGTYLVPVRVFSEYFQCGVYWNQETRGIIVTKTPTQEEQTLYQGLVMHLDDRAYFENGVGKTADTRVVAFNGTSYLPVRLVSEYLGATVTWNKEDGSATLTIGEDWLTLNQNTNVIRTNKEDSIIERNPFSQDDRYMVPIRVISEFFGCTVTWNQSLMSFLITKDPVSDIEKETKFSLIQNRLGYITMLENYRETESPYTMVINRTYKIPANYIAGTGKLATVEGVQMESNAAAALKQMVQGLRASGKNIYIQSGYRTDATQEYLYNRQIGRQGGNALKAATISAVPLSSEHQAGLAVDLSIDGTLTRNFASTAQGKWLAANCTNYGYILRYTVDKQKVTGIIFEPWHFRYVGSPEMAKAITASGLCMEEYFNKYLADGDLTPYLPYL